MAFRTLAALLLCGLAVSTVHAAGVEAEHLTEFGKGIITDYSDMSEAGDIEWAWVAPGTKLSKHRFTTAPVQNLTSVTNGDMKETFDRDMGRALKDISANNPDAPELQVTSAIYWANRASAGKRWIPYAGGHLAQAGIGIELVVTDAAGKIVAKVRHSGREGDELENAAEELVDDFTSFLESR